jgi:hypothetical protein
MGGTKDVFPTTRWSEILNVGTLDESQRKTVISELLRRYWKPVYCYLRHRGYANEPAKDLTQGFFCENVLSHGLIQRADQAKGRFRTFLLTALDHYVSSTYRKETAAKRMPTDGVRQMDGMDLPDFLAAPSGVRPDQVFCYAWATSFLDEVMAQVKQECHRTNTLVYWEVFRERIVKPILEDTEAPSLAAICAKYGINGESKASNMIVTVKRRVRATMGRCLGAR